jgi:hypothetical protein
MTEKKQILELIENVDKLPFGLKSSVVKLDARSLVYSFSLLTEGERVHRLAHDLLKVLDDSDDDPEFKLYTIALIGAVWLNVSPSDRLKTQQYIDEVLNNPSDDFRLSIKDEEFKVRLKAFMKKMDDILKKLKADVV